MNSKQLAAEHAVQFIKDGMTVGLGTGSTSAFAIDAIGKKVQQGLSIKAVASSLRSEEQAQSLGITLLPFFEVQTIDVYIDGADEVNKDLHLIKGGGGALLREKILAYHSKQFIVITDSSKQVDFLGKFLLPVEIIPFAKELTIKKLQSLGCTTRQRMHNNEAYITDNNNFIVDCDFKKISEVRKLHDSINAIPGVVENGLFLNDIVAKVVVGFDNGEVEMREKSA